MTFKTMAAAAMMMAMASGAAMAQPGGGQGNPMMAKFREACGADIQKYCADKTGPDRRACMMENHDKFTDTCKAAIAEMQAMRQNAPKPN
jgi:hypothetical protein